MDAAGFGREVHADIFGLRLDALFQLGEGLFCRMARGAEGTLFGAVLRRAADGNTGSHERLVHAGRSTDRTGDHPGRLELVEGGRTLEPAVEPVIPVTFECELYHGVITSVTY